MAWVSSARAPLRRISVRESLKAPGWVSLITLLSDTAYHSFIGEVEALNTTTIRRLTPSCRHQILTIAPGIVGGALVFEGIQSMFGQDDAATRTGNQAALPGLGETFLSKRYGVETGASAAGSTSDHKYAISRVQSDGKSDDKVMPAGKSTE